MKTSKTRVKLGTATVLLGSGESVVKDSIYPYFARFINAFWYGLGRTIKPRNNQSLFGVDRMNPVRHCHDKEMGISNGRDLKMG